MLTPGNVADITVAVPLLDAARVSRIRPRRFIADKAYDANSLRKWLKVRRIRAVIPSSATRTKPFRLDRKAYRRRAAVECFFRRLKDWRRLATRYDRLARNYLASVCLASLIITAG